jgi:hypothetical protein
VTTPDSAEVAIARRIRDVLEDWCVNNVAEDDPSRADHVIRGKPTSERSNEIVISVHTHHPLGLSKSSEGVVDGPPVQEDERPYKWPMMTTGGFTTSKAIGAVQINIRLRAERELAERIIGAVAERVKQGVNRDKRLAGFKDEMGNFVSSVEAFETRGAGSGADNVSLDNRWITWRAWVHSRRARVTL